MQNRFMQTDGYSTLRCANSSTAEDYEDQILCCAQTGNLIGNRI